MDLLNGLPPILGLGIVHVTVINIAAVFIEYFYIRQRHSINQLQLRTIIANLVSLVVGLTVMVIIPEYMGGNIARTDSDMTGFDKVSLAAGLLGLFLVNVIIEFPAYLVGQKLSNRQTGNLFKTVLVANLWSNISVFLLYSILFV